MVPIPDSLKGHLPFAFAASSSQSDSLSLSPPKLLEEVNKTIRHQIGPIATLGGIIVAPGVIPKTRSGKTLRRVLRQLLEDASKGEFDKEVSVPATVEDISVVENARKVIRQYYKAQGDGSHVKAKL